MSAKNLLLVGAGGHARACIDVIEAQGQFVLRGLIGLAQEIGAQQLGYTVVGADTDLQELISTNPYALVGIGQIADCAPRISAFERLCALGFELPTVVSPHAYVSRHAHIGPGTVVMHGAVVNAGARVGANCIINSHAIIEHDVSIGDHCHISTSTVVNGAVQIGSSCFVGSASALREGISLGDGAFIAMGLTVRHDISAGSRYIG